MNSFTLVLEGGGMRGLFTAGVLDFFMEHSLLPELTVGVSAGALNAINMKANQKGRSLRINVNYCDDKRYLSVSNLVSEGTIFNLDFLFGDLSKRFDPLDYNAFANSKQRLVSVVTNMNTGKAEYPFIVNMRTDDVYVKASASLPIVGKKVEIDGNDYLDGGVADSIPLDFALQQSNKKIVLVLTRAAHYRKERVKGASLIPHLYKEYPKFAEQLEHRHIHYNETLQKVEQLEKEGEIFVIRPQSMPHVSRIETNKDKLKELYNLGYQAAEMHFSGLKEYLEKDNS